MNFDKAAAKVNERMSRVYGLKLGEFEEMLRSQDGRCVICRADNPGRAVHNKKSWCIDHDHSTNKVRGILCHHCNSAIGLFRENINTMKAAINYLQKWKMKCV